MVSALRSRRKAEGRRTKGLASLNDLQLTNIWFKFYGYNMLLISQLFAFMACSHPSLGCDLFQSHIKPSLAGPYLDVRFCSLLVYGCHGKLFVFLGCHAHLPSATEPIPWNLLILIVLAKVLTFRWDEETVGCIGWSQGRWSFTSLVVATNGKQREMSGNGKKGNKQFPHHSPLASMSTGKKIKMNEVKGRSFLS